VIRIWRYIHILLSSNPIRILFEFDEPIFLVVRANWSGSLQMKKIR